MLNTFRRRAVAATCITLMIAFAASAWSRDVKARTDQQFDTSRSLIGNYLAGRFARSDNDSSRAAHYYRGALARDPENSILLEQAFLMEATEGTWSRAIPIAKTLVEKQPTHRMARIALGIDAYQKRQFSASRKHLKSAANGPIGELTSAIATAWVLVEQGQTDKAFQALRVPRQAEWAKFYLRYHRALIADLAGRPREARAAFQRVYQQDSRTLRTALAYARHLAKNGKTDRAKQVLAGHVGNGPDEGHPLAVELMQQIEAGAPIELLVNNPREGLAEVFYGLGEALTGEGGVSIGLLYLQMALYLEPEQPFALAALANAYEATKRYQDAIDTYDRIPEGSPLEASIEIRKAFNLNSLDRVDEAESTLLRVANANPDDMKPLDALGNIMRARKRYEEAVKYYTRAIDLIDEPTKRDWAFFYSRGTCFERLKQWPDAEKDLLKALELYPDQPLALNYLGYSWIDQNRNLTKGLGLIEKAVKLKPEDGYIVDSLGWAHFKLGNYEKAVENLERAVELRPEDPVLNDHLGDALWQVGRRREARYQWEQALTLEPEPEVLRDIKKKIADGLSVETRSLQRTDASNMTDSDTR